MKRGGVHCWGCMRDFFIYTCAFLIVTGIALINQQSFFNASCVVSFKGFKSWI